MTTAPLPQFVVQGDYRVEKPDHPDAILSTLLGSCISACIFDPEIGAGGMNHFLLAEGNGTSSSPASYGVNAMELVINGLLRLGAKRERLKAHVFGGARVVRGLSDVGEKNAKFCLSFLETESIPVVECGIGGARARRISFWPATGVITQRLVSQPVKEEPAPAPKAPKSGGIELF